MLGLVALTAGCRGDRELTADEARAFTERAWRAAGVQHDGVDPVVEQAACGSRGVDGWLTRTEVEGGTLELCVDRRGDRAVFVDDLGPDEQTRLLDDAQFRALDEFRYDPVAAEQRRRVTAFGTLAGALVALLAGALVLLTTRRRPPAARPVSTTAPASATATPDLEEST